MFTIAGLLQVLTLIFAPTDQPLTTATLKPLMAEITGNIAMGDCQISEHAEGDILIKATWTSKKDLGAFMSTAQVISTGVVLDEAALIDSLRNANKPFVYSPITATLSLNPVSRKLTKIKAL